MRASSRVRVLVAVITVSGAGIILSCVGDSTDTPSKDHTGEEGQACYANGTCNVGLTCISKVCVNLTGDGAAATDATDATTTGSDGAMPSEALTDAGTDAKDSGPTGPWCLVNAPDATWCADFDETTDPAQIGGPSYMNVDASSAISISSAAPSSPPHSLITTISGDPNPEVADIIHNLVVVPTTSISLQMDMKCNYPTQVGTVGFALLFNPVGGGSEYHQVATLLNPPNQLTINEGYTPEGGSFNGGPGVGGAFDCGDGGFAHLLLTITPPHAKLFVNGTMLADLTLTNFRFLSAQAQIGVGFTTSSAPVTTNIDNVVVTVE